MISSITSRKFVILAVIGYVYIRISSLDMGSDYSSDWSDDWSADSTHVLEPLRSGKGWRSKDDL